MSPNIADLANDTHESAKKRTAVILGELNEIRRTLEMPADQFPIVIEMYKIQVATLVAEAAREELAKRTRRLPITMRSENNDGSPRKILTSQTVNVNAWPQTSTFRPEDIAIHGDRSRWRVHDIKIGSVSQFASHRGPAPGSEFGPGGILEHMRLATAQAGMTIVFVIEYIGPAPEGEVFEATLVGTAVE